MPFELHEAFREKPEKDEKDETAEKSEKDAPTEKSEKDADTVPPGPETQESHKNKGNDAFKAGNFDEAIKHYDNAIALDDLYPGPSLYSNRAACWSQKGEHEKALADAEKCIGIDSKFTKGYTRKGLALFYLKRLDQAEQAYMEGLKIDPDSEPCKRGLADVQEGKERASRRSTPFQRIVRSAKKVPERMMSLSGALSGRRRLQIGILVLALSFVGGLFVYQRHKGGRTDKASTMQIQRRFRQLDGLWMSYLEAGGSANTKVLFLHRRSLSAEAEFGAVIPQVLSKASPTGLFKVVAPDRPCHGFSLCPEKGEPAEMFSLFARILSERPLAQHFAYVTSGREAAQHALEIVQRRRQSARMLLVRPHLTGIDTEGLRSSLVAAESARWAMLASNHSRFPPREGGVEPMNVAKMPEGCRVLLIYLPGDQEDEALKAALKAVEVTVEVRRLNSLEDGLVSAVLQMFGGSGASATLSSSSDADSEAEQAPSEPQAAAAFSEFESTSSDTDLASLFSKEKVIPKLNAWASHIVSRLPLLFGGHDEEVW